MRIEIKMPEEYKDTEMFYEDGKLNIIDKKWLAKHDKELIAKYISDYVFESYEEHDKQIKAEAIDEFLNEVEEWGSYGVFHRYDDFYKMHQIMKKVAEELKEQK